MHVPQSVAGVENRGIEACLLDVHMEEIGQRQHPGPLSHPRQHRRLPDPLEEGRFIAVQRLQEHRGAPLSQLVGNPLVHLDREVWQRRLREPRRRSDRYRDDAGRAKRGRGIDELGQFAHPALALGVFQMHRVLLPRRADRGDGDAGFPAGIGHQIRLLANVEAVAVIQLDTVEAERGGLVELLHEGRARQQGLLHGKSEWHRSVLSFGRACVSTIMHQDVPGGKPLPAECAS